MQLQKATRKQTKIKLSISGTSGSGKTYSSLLLAHGICGKWDSIAVLDSENYSASLYAHLGPFNVINLQEPFTPEQYIDAIHLCEKSGIKVIIIDSISHEWSGKGGCLEIHEKETARMKIPNSFTAWATVTPRHQAFIDAIVRSQCHIICCTRSKTEYVLSERNGRQVPQKVGMSPITRDGFEFEVSIHFELDQQHKAFCSKDRTGLFMNLEPTVISEETGAQIIRWCESGEPVNVDDVTIRINACKSLNELLQVYKEYPQFKQILLPEYEQRKRELIINREVQNQLVNHPINENGSH
ncbi:MAG: AAA family ATPase [Chitinophagaceae bacterium]|nr:AAA family ATPase [Chitinophagaceae bacterium]MCA6465552.1 AAA family ATPase [Chitinophagaceae bacterium]